MSSINTDGLTNEELFKKFPLIDTNDLSWGIASKTKPVKAKHLSSIVIDTSVLAKILLETIEGREALNQGANNVICVGEAGDIWQQDSKKFISKYDVKEITSDGWFVAVPKDGNESLFYKVTDTELYPLGFSIIGAYGEERVIDGKTVRLQFGLPGAYILGSTENKDDRWLVAESFFNQTYEIKKWNSKINFSLTGS